MFDWTPLLLLTSILELKMNDEKLFVKKGFIHKDFILDLIR